MTILLSTLKPTFSSEFALVSGNCSGSTLNIISGYRSWKKGRFTVPTQTYTGSISGAGFFNTSEAVASGDAFRYFYVNPNIPTHIYVSDSPPSSGNTRTIAGVEVVFLVALSMSNSSTYRSQTFFNDRVVYNASVNTILLGTIPGRSVFNAATNINHTFTVNLVTSGFLPSQDIINEASVYHAPAHSRLLSSLSWATVRTSLDFAGLYVYNDRTSPYRPSGGTNYSIVFGNIRHCMVKQSSINLNQNSNWVRSVSDSSGFVSDDWHSGSLDYWTSHLMR